MPRCIPRYRFFVWSAIICAVLASTPELHAEKLHNDGGVSVDAVFEPDLLKDAYASSEFSEDEDVGLFQFLLKGAFRIFLFFLTSVGLSYIQPLWPEKLIFPDPARQRPRAVPQQTQIPAENESPTQQETETAC